MAQTNQPIILSQSACDIWNELAHHCQTLTEPERIDLKKHLQDKVQTIVIEPTYICKDYRNLFSNYLFSKEPVPSPFCARIHFFSECFTESQLYTNPKINDAYIGFSVIRPLTYGSLGRTVIDPYKIGISPDEHCYLLRTPFSVHLNGLKLEVSGFPYMAQDGEVLLCGQTTIWAVCRYFSERYPNYHQWYPFDIIRHTSNEYGRIFPYRYMSYTDYCRIISAFGCSPIIISKVSEEISPPDLPNTFPKPPAAPVPSKTILPRKIKPKAFEELYSYMESGIPLLASHHDHVTAIIGHTIDYDREVTPDSDNLIDASAYVGQFLIVDDNCFPYQRLGRRGDPLNYSQEYSLETLLSITCPLPSKLRLPAIQAREGCKLILKKMRADPGYKLPQDQPLVTRLFATTGSSLKSSLLRNFTPGQIWTTSIEALLTSIHLPPFVWIMEISTPELYRHKKCLGEIVIDTTATLSENLLIYARTQASILLNGKNYPQESEPFLQFINNLGKK